MSGPYKVYTDGSCRGNPGPGGWGAVIVGPDGAVQKELSGGAEETTNNRMELQAAVATLEFLPPGSCIEIWTDSRYLRDGITSWIRRWERNGWRTTNRKPVRNAELWRRLVALEQAHSVTWHWLRGHAGHPRNERADRLATAATPPGVAASPAPRSGRAGPEPGDGGHAAGRDRHLRRTSATGRAAQGSAMHSRVVPVDCFDLVVFGATGDLAVRKILPALLLRENDAQFPEECRIIGLARAAGDSNSWRAQVAAALGATVARAGVAAGTLQRFLARLHYLPADAKGTQGWRELQELLAGHEDRVRVFYFAVAPQLFAAIAGRLAACGLVTPASRIVLEKPVGHDRASAMAVNTAVGQVFDERQIFRIDHFLGKETVQNLMALRFANAMFEPLWNASRIDHVQITVAETAGVAGRGAYYDAAGALRDMVQNHLLQLLCLVAIEPPHAMDADAIRDEKLKVLRALRPIGAGAVHHRTVRGQYRAGSSGAGVLPGYPEDCGVAASGTESFVALRVELDNWRWAGTPFYLRTGKRLARRSSEIVIAFRPVGHSIFAADAGRLVPNRLVLQLQPDEGVRLGIMIKDPGPGGMRLRHVPLDMSFAEAFASRHPDAYERLITDVIRGNQTLFMRRDEVELAWQWIDPIRTAWDAADDAPYPYAAGSWGPAAAIALIERDGRSWLEEAAP